LKPEHKINIVRKEKMSIGAVPGGTFDFSQQKKVISQHSR
jgi:hypothetical protein